MVSALSSQLLRAQSGLVFMRAPVERLSSSSLSSMSPFLAVLVSASVTAVLVCCLVVSVFLSVLTGFSYWLYRPSREFVGLSLPGVHGKAGYRPAIEHSVTAITVGAAS